MLVPQASRSTMKDDGQGGARPTGKAARDGRQERLKLALRENLKRRKSQARSKGDLKGDFTPVSSVTDEVVGESDEESPG
jgi:hypothetical protein